METIREAKKFIKGNIYEGVECPCCGQFAKAYKRKLYKTQALSLISLYNLSGGNTDKYFHVKDIEASFRGSGGGDMAKLRFWGLIQEMEKESDESKRTSGMWRITRKGVLFVTDEMMVLSHVVIYNQKPYGFDGDHISIRDALGEEFNYQELMGVQDQYEKQP